MALKYTEQAAQEFVPIDNGVYAVKVATCEEKYDKNEDPYFKAQLRITSEKFKNRIIWANYIGAKSIGHMLASCGVSLEYGTDIEAAQLVGLCGRVRTEQEEYKGKWDAKVAAWIPPSKEEAEAPLAAMPGTGAMPEFTATAERPPDHSPDALDDIPF